MIIRTFRRGVCVPDLKDTTKSLAVKELPAPKILVFPLSQHIGAPATPTVKVGDYVKRYQKIGEASGFVSANVHSSVSGTVVAIEERPVANGSLVTSIVVENDFLDDEIDLPDVSGLSLVECVREAGITGMGGAGFPTHVKLSIPEGKKIDTVILNGAECEPYLTSDHRVMVDNPKLVLEGILAMVSALGAERGIIAIEENKPDAIYIMQREAKKYENIEVYVLKTKYPQGSEKQIIDACLKRKVPRRGLPSDVGVLVANTDTATAVARSLRGIPLCERIVTVSGSAIYEPSNFKVRLGTPVSELIKATDTNTEDIAKLISGGPMMGIALSSFDVPVTKGMGAILAFSEDEGQIPMQSACINCARCADSCPIGLLPMKLNTYAEKGLYDQCNAYHIFDCIECGSCAYVCPAKRYIVQSIRLAKQKLRQGGTVK